MQSAKAPDDLSAVKDSMNNMYRWTRHVYDASRKYYLLGRDRLIRELKLHPGDVVIEAGCGTARNLIKMAHAYPKTHFYGFDASEEMLKTAAPSVEVAGFEKEIKLAHGFAQNFDPQVMFGVAPGTIDRIVFSYALSMIPPWKESLDHALTLLKPGGRIEIVDFGSQEGLPAWFRSVLYGWLDLFGVHFRPEMLHYIRTLPGHEVTDLYGGYSYIARITKTT